MPGTMARPSPGWFSGHLHTWKREAATIKVGKLCRLLQVCAGIAKKYNGKRFVKEFNKDLMNS